MGAKDPNRQPRLRGLRNTPPGWIRVASCNKCRHKGPLPVDALIRKFGDLALVEFALVSLKCTDCGHIGASALMLRLCEPGCPGSGTSYFTGKRKGHVRNDDIIGSGCMAYILLCSMFQQEAQEIAMRTMTADRALPS